MARYGSGSIFKRGKKGTWYYQAWFDGKQYGPYSSSSTDRKQAQNKLDKLLGKRERGELAAPGKGNWKTVLDVVKHYLNYADERLESKRIIRWVMEKNVIPKLGHLKISLCDLNRLRLYRQQRKLEDADDVTINRELSYLRAGWRRAMKEGYIHQIPYFPTVKENNVRRGFLEEIGFIDLLDKFPDPLKPFAASAYYAGLRRGELLRIEPADVYLDRGFIEIRKTKNSEPRVVPIITGPMEVWLRWALSKVRPGQKKLFVWEDGRPFTERNFYDEWNAACDRAGFAEFILHDSRRSASRNMRNQGVSQRVRMAVMGHKTEAMDRRYGITDFADAVNVRDIMKKRTTVKTTDAKKIGSKKKDEK